MKKIFVFLFSGLVVFQLSGCLSIAHTIGTEAASGQIEHFSGVYELEMKETPEETESDFTQSLLALGFKRSANNILKFDKGSGKAANYGLSKYYSINVSAEIKEGKIVVSILQTGNYKYGTEEKTNETFESIKEKYLAKEFSALE